MLLRLVLAAILGATVTAHSDERLPLFDGHLHYNAGSSERYPPETVLAVLDRAGIVRALLSSTPNDGTALLYARYPDRFVPELRPYRMTRDLQSFAEVRRTWFKDPETVVFVERELARGIYRGIGEFHLDGAEADTPVIAQLVELAMTRNLWLHAHSDAAAVEKLYRFQPDIRIVWAHAGMTEPPGTIARMLERHPSLIAELSYRYEISASGQLDPEWKALLLRFPDRFIYGTDTWTPSRWDEVVSLADQARRWLTQLPPDVAQRIAFRNAEVLFAR